MYSRLSPVVAVAALSTLAVLLEPATAFDPISITIGTTVFALTGSQVALGVAGLAGLAIVKEKLAIAGLSRASRRGRREAEEQEALNLGPFYDAIATADVADCGKLLVCHVMSKDVKTLSVEEQRLANLFDDLEQIDVGSAHANYQLAALVGSLRSPGLCQQRYARCPVDTASLERVLEAHSP